MNLYSKDNTEENEENLKRYLSLINITVFVSIIILSYFLLMPFYKLIVKQEKEIIPSRMKSNAEKQANLDQIAKFQKDVPEFESKIDILDKIEDNQNDMGQFFVQAGKLTKNSKLTVTAFSPDISSDQHGIQVGLTGNYENFVSFLDSLENNLLLIDVKTLSISGQGEIMTFSLTAKAPRL